MTEPHRALHVHPLSPEDWESDRDVRLAMLQDEPDAFWFTFADEAVSLINAGGSNLFPVEEDLIDDGWTACTAADTALMFSAVDSPISMP